MFQSGFGSAGASIFRISTGCWSFTDVRWERSLNEDEVAGLAAAGFVDFVTLFQRSA